MKWQETIHSEWNFIITVIIGVGWTGWLLQILFLSEIATTIRVVLTVFLLLACRMCMKAKDLHIESNCANDMDQNPRQASFCMSM